MQAVASVDAAARARSLLRTQLDRDAAALEAQAREVTERQHVLTTTSLPLAHRLVDTLERAVQQGGAGLSELLLARRSLGELQLDAADVQLLSYRIASELARNGAVGPPAPPELAPAMWGSDRSAHVPNHAGRAPLP